MTYDYSHYTVQLQPVARQLYEQLAMRDWRDAERSAALLSDLAFELRQYAMRQQVQSGVGYVYEGA